MSTLTVWSYIVYDGRCWCGSGSFPNPGNSSVSVPTKSTHKVIELWDGDQAIITPSVNFRNEPITWEITEASSTVAIYNTLNDFNKNHRKLTITDHVNNTYTGYFDSIEKIITLSGSTQRYILKCTFILE